MRPNTSQRLRRGSDDGHLFSIGPDKGLRLAVHCRARGRGFRWSSPYRQTTKPCDGTCEGSFMVTRRTLYGGNCATELHSFKCGSGGLLAAGFEIPLNLRGGFNFKGSKEGSKKAGPRVRINHSFNRKRAQNASLTRTHSTCFAPSWPGSHSLRKGGVRGSWRGEDYRR